MQVKKLNHITWLFIFLFISSLSVFAQQQPEDSTKMYKKRVLESTEIDLLAGYYNQDGDNGAVCGGIGTQKLQDIAPTIVIAVPLNADDVVTVDAGISAYTSASSSNINPFDGTGDASPYQASTGASRSDALVNFSGSYSHSSDDRNRIWSGKVSGSNEHDYSSFGFGGSYAMLFNEKNTELSVSGNVYLDNWRPVYPYELRPYSGIHVSGWNPNYTEFTKVNRNSYSAGLVFSQILTKYMQASISLDLVKQEGLLSTPFQRVYFSDKEDYFRLGFHLADDIERLPGSRSKVAIGGRLNYYINEFLTLRTYYRYYTDDWGINSNTASIEIPVKISGKFTIYPSYRYYDQTAAKYFAPYNEHLSTEKYYTSDYDLSGFTAHQYGLGVTYTDIFMEAHIWKFGLKSIDLRFDRYTQSYGLRAFNIAAGAKFVLD